MSCQLRRSVLPSQCNAQARYLPGTLYNCWNFVRGSFGLGTIKPREICSTYLWRCGTSCTRGYRTTQHRFVPFLLRRGHRIFRQGNSYFSVFSLALTSGKRGRACKPYFRMASFPPHCKSGPTAPRSIPMHLSSLFFSLAEQ